MVDAHAASEIGVPILRGCVIFGLSMGRQLGLWNAGVLAAGLR